MRRRLLLPCLLVSAVVLAACSSGDPDGTESETASPSSEAATTDAATTEAADGLLTAIDVCAHDGDAAPCLDDEGDPALRCSVEVDTARLEATGAAETEVAYALTYQGEPVIEGATPLGDMIAGDETPDTPLTLDFSMGGLPLPAGEYGCSISAADSDLDAVATVADGPDTRAWNVATCTQEDAVEVGSGQVCAEHVPTFDEVAHLVCSAGVALQGEGVRMEVVWVPPADSQPFRQQEQFIDVEPTGLPVHSLNVTLDARAFGPPGQGTAGDPLPAGEYTCNFREVGSGDGEVFASTTFEITG